MSEGTYYFLKHVRVGDFITYEVDGSKYRGILKEVYDGDDGEKMIKVFPDTNEAPSHAKLSTARKY